MCRNIRTLHNFAPPATEDEIRASSLQFVRKLSGFTKPSKANEDAFNRAIDQVTRPRTNCSIPWSRMRRRAIATSKRSKLAPDRRSASPSAPVPVAAGAQATTEPVSCALSPADAFAARFATNAPLSRSRCLTATAAIASKPPAARFQRGGVCAGEGVQDYERLAALLFHDRARWPATTSAAFAPIAGRAFSAALVMRGRGSSPQAWTIPACSNRRCISGRPTRSRGITWIRRCRSSTNIRHLKSG